MPDEGLGDFTDRVKRYFIKASEYHEWSPIYTDIG